MSDKLQEIRERLEKEREMAGRIEFVEKALNQYFKTNDYRMEGLVGVLIEKCENLRRNAESAESRLLLAEKLLRRLFDETDAMYQD